MKNLLFSDIDSFVRSKLDELSDDSGFVSSDNIDIVRIIRESAVNVIRNVHLMAPNVLLDGVTYGSQNITLYNGKDNMYWFEVPDNFMRLVSLKTNDWDRPVQTLISEDSVEYRRQRNKYLRGTPRNPVAAIRHGVGNKRIIELYTITPDVTARIYDFSFVPEITSDPTGIGICPKLRQACLYSITAEVMRCLNETQRAQMYDALAAQSLNPTSDAERTYPLNGEKTIE